MKILLDKGTKEMHTYELLCKMPDAASYAGTINAHRALYDIAERHIEKLDAELSALTEKDSLRRRAYMISKNMAELCRTFVSFTWRAGTVAEYVSKRMDFIRREHVTDGMEEALANLAPDELGVFAVFAHATWFLHDAFLDRRTAEIAESYENGHPERAFEANIIVDIIYDICREWLAWYRENGSVPFEKWNYDQHPAKKYTEAES